MIRRVIMAVAIPLMLLETASGQQLLNRIRADVRGITRRAVVQQRPYTGQDNEIEKLAREIDWIESHIDKFGSVVAKQPDVWGESRLTKYRREFEKELTARLGHFTPRDNAAITRSDMAFLASATAFSAAINGTTPSNVNVSATSGGAADANSNAAEPTPISQSISIGSNTLESGTAFTAGTNLDINEELNQRARYVNHLHQLRRISSADDVSNSPGYSLNLVRIPVSINPGRITRRGYGAEVTITAEPVLSNTLLPQTFKNLVINDLVDQLALPIMRLAENNDIEAWKAAIEFDAAYGTYARRIVDINARIEAGEQICVEDVLNYIYKTGTLDKDLNLARKLTNGVLRALNAALTNKNAEASEKKELTNLIESIKQQFEELAKFAKNDPRRIVTPNADSVPAVAEASGLVRLAKEVQKNIARISAIESFAKAAVVNPAAQKRRSVLPIPQVLLSDVLDHRILIVIAHEFRRTYSGRMVAWNEDPNAPRMHLTDVRSFLQSNFESAFRMVTTDNNIPFVQEAIEGPTGLSLANEIREARTSSVDLLRINFMNQLDGTANINSTGKAAVSPILRSFTWPIVVEMALLNDQLNRDIHDVAVTKGDCGCHPTQRYAYYLPMPSTHQGERQDTEFRMASEQFINYVRCRWPIHVFHVDPVNEDQNVQDSSVISRELSIAMAIGVASGQVNFRQASQFVRQYSESIQTIGLNRTISGFGHGEDTFGWTFRPRVQTHPNRGTIKAFGETLLGRGPDANLRDSGLEPGMRECTAIVLMPSFVPYCDFDVATRWFRLDNPRSKELTTHASLKLSRSIKTMKDCSLACVQCEHLYREGESKRLLRRVDQLESKLPFQSMRVSIPYENTFGGFELFSNGVTDFAPELFGWYGAPGIAVGDGDVCCSASCPKDCENPAGDSKPECVHAGGTTIFLVGDNFNVHETQVIAGGYLIPEDHMSLISRGVMRITVPQCVKQVQLRDGNGRLTNFVSIHASTPYGVTSHLHVPMIETKKAVEQSDTAKAIEALEKSVKGINDQLALKDRGTFKWSGPDSLPILASYSQIKNGPYVRTGLALGNLPGSTPFSMKWDSSLGLPLTPAKLAIAGQFELDGKLVGQSFWIESPTEGPLLMPTTGYQVSANQLLLKIADPIGQYLTMDKTGIAEKVEVNLQTWVVEVREINGSFDVIGEPTLTPSPIKIELIRRVNPQQPVIGTLVPATSDQQK